MSTYISDSCIYIRKNKCKHVSGNSHWANFKVLQSRNTANKKQKKLMQSVKGYQKIKQKLTVHKLPMTLPTNPRPLNVRLAQLGTI